MSTTRDLIIYGAGGLGSEIVSMAESGCYAGRDTWRWNVIGFVDDRIEFWGKSIHGIPCLGPLNKTAEVRTGLSTFCHVAMGNNEDRRQGAARIKALGWKAGTVIHHSAYVSWETEIGYGTFIGPHVTISPNVNIGWHTLINTRASIGHHAVLGDFSQVSLGASVLGRATVEEGAMIGAHSVIMSNVTVGAWATVAIGTPILKKVEAGHTVSLPLAKTLFKRNLDTVKTAS